jgi:hypothetical protein
MFSTLSRKAQIQSMPITRASHIPRTSIQQPTSWLSRIKTSLGTWNARRFYQSLSGLLAIKTKEEHIKHVQELQKAGKPLSPTQAHLAYGLAEPAFTAEQKPLEVIMKHLPTFKNLNITQIDEIIKKEKEFFDSGYTVLYHATEPEYYGLHYIDTQCAILNKKLVETKIFQARLPLILRQKKLIYGEEIEKVTRERLIEKGSPSDWEEREFLLSCSPAIMSNLNDNGECTLSIWERKENHIHPMDADQLRKAFYQFSARYNILGFYTNTYIQEFEQSVKKLNINLKTGILLQLIFKDPRLVEECVYTSVPFGRKRNVCLQNDQTGNIAKIMQAYSTAKPELSSKDINEIQYRVVLTADKLLDVLNKNIYENFEIHAYANPQSVLEEFHKEINNIMRKIEQDFNSKEVTMRIEQDWQKAFKYEALKKEENLANVRIKELKLEFEKFQEFNRKRFGQTIEPVISTSEEL